jgi:hypothetical protein
MAASPAAKADRDECLARGKSPIAAVGSFSRRLLSFFGFRRMRG